MRCKTCKKKFKVSYFGQKNCKTKDKCIEAEESLWKSVTQKRFDKQKEKQENKPQGVLKIVNNLSPKELRDFKEAFKKEYTGIPSERPKLILVNKKTPKPFSAKNSKPKSRSKKQIVIDTKYHKMLEEMDASAEKKCTGCGRYQGGDIQLSHSHIISRADCKRYGRPDLISDARNVTYHCLDFGENIGCHGRHEQRDDTLLDFEVKREFVYEICVEIQNDELLNKLI